MNAQKNGRCVKVGRLATAKASSIGGREGDGRRTLRDVLDDLVGELRAKLVDEVVALLGRSSSRANGGGSAKKGREEREKGRAGSPDGADDFVALLDEDVDNVDGDEAYESKQGGQMITMMVKKGCRTDLKLQ